MSVPFSRIGSAALCIAITCAEGHAEIIDRISIIVGKMPIKRSDIEREIRIVSFLNGTAPDMSLKSQKAVADRLIDQMLTRQEIQMTGVAAAPLSDAEHLLEQIRQERFPKDAMFDQALSRYGITQAEVKAALLWQLTVLRFIAQRFGGSVSVSDQELEEYFNAHRDALIKAHPEAHSASDLRDPIVAEISDEQVNREFEAWLAQARKDTRIDYREEDLR